MPKRRAESKIDYYTNKIKKLQMKQQKRNQKRRVIFSSSDSEENEDNGALKDNMTDNISSDPQEADIEDNVVATPPASIEIEHPELEPELLLALGDAVNEQPMYGENIHNSLAQRWLPILKKGLSKEVKETLLKEYLIPENCKLLKAPALNAEISVAVAEVVRNRDRNIKTKQDQLGVGIAAINKAITLLLLGNEKVQAIKILSDGCRILTDLHYVDTQVRTKLITPCLEKSFMPIIQDLERDDTLFGTKLSEKIKASKAIEKQGLQIKKSTICQKAGSSSAGAATVSATPRSRYQSGNWMRPPRYPSSNRGGRGGPQRPGTSYRRAPAAAEVIQPRASSNQYRQRAPTRH